MAKVDEILRQFYYHNPDELGEDAFNNLGDDEVAEVKQALYKDLLELIPQPSKRSSGVLNADTLNAEYQRGNLYGYNEYYEELRDKLKDYFGITE